MVYIGGSRAQVDGIECLHCAWLFVEAETREERRRRSSVVENERKLNANRLQVWLNFIERKSKTNKEQGRIDRRSTKFEWNSPPTRGEKKNVGRRGWKRRIKTNETMAQRQQETKNDVEAFRWFNCSDSLLSIQSTNSSSTAGDILLNRWVSDIMSYRIWISSIIQMIETEESLVCAPLHARNCMEKMRCSLNTSSNSIRNVDPTCQEPSEHTHMYKKKRDIQQRNSQKRRTLDVWSIRDEPSSLRKKKKGSIGGIVRRGPSERPSPI